MITNIKEYMNSITIGIKYGPNFSIQDMSGKIIDDILYSKNEIFNSLFFPEMNTSQNFKQLINTTTNNQLMISERDLILTCSTEWEKGSIYIKANDNKKHKLGIIIDEFNKLIINNIMKSYKFSRINRIGYVSRYEFPFKDFSNSFIHKTIGNKEDEITDMELKFSQRYPLKQEFLQKDVYDFNNVIYNIIKRKDSDFLQVSCDFQRYYEPTLDSSIMIDFKSFIDKGEKFNNFEFKEWINKNYGKS